MLRSAGDQLSPFWSEFLKILRFKFPTAGPSVHAAAIEQAFASRIRCYEKCDLKQIQRMLTDNRPLDEVFCAFPFPTSVDLGLVNPAGEVSTPTDVVVYGMLNQGIAWVASPCYLDGSFPPILRILTSFIASHADQATVVSVLMIRTYLSNPKASLDSDSFSAICCHISSNRHLGSDFGGVFRAFYGRVVSPDDSTSREFFKVCCGFLGRPFFALPDHGEMMVPLTMHILKLDVNAIRLLCAATAIHSGVVPEFLP
jgi:hypothetical protein